MYTLTTQELLVQLTWVYTGFLFISSAQQYIYLSATCIQHPSNVLLSDKRRRINPTIASPLSHLSLTMLFLLFIYYYLVQESFIDASPILSMDGRSLAANHCNDLGHCRTIWNIVWSCFATIFSCTWVAIHPNIPCPKKRNPIISFAEHRLPLFVCALLVPEYVLAWAIRQFLRARRIARDNKGEFDT